MMLNCDHYYSCIFILVALKELVLVSEEGGREKQTRGKEEEGRSHIRNYEERIKNTLYNR